MKLSLGIDTSNYTTSVALVNGEGELLFDGRKLLSVKEGERGLRQQEALFQHINNLPGLLEEAFTRADELHADISVVSASNKPRPEQGSYMPCFIAGENQCRIISSLLKCKSYFFSHQEGHIASGGRHEDFSKEEKYIAFHFSGGTTEALECNKGEIKIIGGTKDISFGQLLDRFGVAMGMKFPAGKEVDRMAVSFESRNVKDDYRNILPKLSAKDIRFNLSGMETAVYRAINSVQEDALSYMILERVSECISTLLREAREEVGGNSRNEIPCLFVGGVSSSQYIRKYISSEFENVYFPKPKYCSDSAIGIAYLGGDKIWH